MERIIQNIFFRMFLLQRGSEELLSHGNGPAVNNGNSLNSHAGLVDNNNDAKKVSIFSFNFYRFAIFLKVGIFVFFSREEKNNVIKYVRINRKFQSFELLVSYSVGLDRVILFFTRTVCVFFFFFLNFFF